MSQLFAAFLAGLISLNPVISLGLIPSSYQGMTRRPRVAATYALSGSLMILSLSVAGWAALRLALPGLGLKTFGLPVLILIYWSLQYVFGLAFRGSPGLKAGLPLNLNGCLAMGCCLFLVEHVPQGMARAAASAAGMSAGHLVLSLAVAYIRERIDAGRMKRLFGGWPVLLVICSLIWLAAGGLGSLMP